ncbi:MAG: hypothetical protein Q9O62_01285 [Ardenticatenia bacterium]|nr:hypothetical protein [Ardenticatenia bacterium]
MGKLTLTERFVTYIEARARGRVVLLFMGLSALLGGVILPATSARLRALSGGVGPLDVLFFYTPARAYAALSAYGDAGRAAYRAGALTADMLFPVSYALFFSLAVAWLCRRGRIEGRCGWPLFLIPLVAGGLDVMENLSVVLMLSLYPGVPPALAWAATSFTAAKWIGVTLSVVTLAVAGWRACMATWGSSG